MTDYDETMPPPYDDLPPKEKVPTWGELDGLEKSLVFMMVFGFAASVLLLLAAAGFLVVQLF